MRFSPFSQVKNKCFFLNNNNENIKMTTVCKWVLSSSSVGYMRIVFTANVQTKRFYNIKNY